MKDAEIKVNLLSIGPFEYEFSRDPSQATAAQRGRESNTVNNNKDIRARALAQQTHRVGKNRFGRSALMRILERNNILCV